MGRTFVTLGVGILMAAAGCGGGGAGAGEPLVSGTLAGQYKNQPFTPTSGIATIYMGENLIGFGDGPVNCGSPRAADPPAGTSALFTIPALAVATYAAVFVQMVQNKGGFDGIGSNTGTVTIHGGQRGVGRRQHRVQLHRQHDEPQLRDLGRLRSVALPLTASARNG